MNSYPFDTTSRRNLNEKPMQIKSVPSHSRNPFTETENVSLSFSDQLMETRDKTTHNKPKLVHRYTVSRLVKTKSSLISFPYAQYGQVKNTINLIQQTIHMT